MLILTAPFSLPWKKIHEWKKVFTKSDVIFWVLIPCLKLLPTTIGLLELKI